MKKLVSLFLALALLLRVLWKKLKAGLKLLWARMMQYGSAASEDYEALLRAIRKLDLQYREVLMLIFVQEHTVKEAAEILRRREGTVRQQLNRGRKKLIELCRKEGILDEWTK